MSDLDVDYSSVMPIQDMVGEDEEDTELLRAMHGTARQYITAQRWCRGIRQEHFGLGVGGIVAVFLFDIEPARGADPAVWCVVGDVPSLYITTLGNPRPENALRGYISEARRWCLVPEGKASRDEVPDFGVPPTREMASRLARRLDFIESNVLA